VHDRRDDGRKAQVRFLCPTGHILHHPTHMCPKVYALRGRLIGDN
jgi:hypothetical protein